MAKYVIEIPDDTKWIDVYYRAKDHWQYGTITKYFDELIPYTEPDEDKSYGTSRYKSIGLAFLKWLGNDAGDKLKSADDVYRFLDKNCCNKDAVEQKAWDFVTVLYGLSDEELYEIFPNGCPYEMTYSEAKAKYEAWKKSKDEIRVGDEVVDGQGIKCVVTSVDECHLHGFRSDNGGACYRQILSVTKTGRHFPEVAELLKKMREE